MKEPTLMKQSRVAVADVIVGDRLRPVSRAGVEALIASVSATGVMKDAIHVRKHHGGELRLVAGAHRLAAAVEMGWADIEAKIWTDVTDDWARLMEIDDNVAGAEMCPLDHAVFLATRKSVYERLYPETKAGVAGALAKHGLQTNSSSFAEATAEKFGISQRQVQKIVAAASRLGPDEVSRLRRAPRPVTLKDLQEVSKIGSPAERYDVVDLLAEGKAKSAADARRAVAQRAGSQDEKAKDPIEEALALIERAWSRAPMVAKRRFAQKHWSEMSLIMRDADGIVDEEAA